MGENFFSLKQMMLIEPIKHLDINQNIQPVCHATHLVHQIEKALRLSAATIEKVLVDEVVPLQKLRPGRHN